MRRRVARSVAGLAATAAVLIITVSVLPRQPASTSVAGAHGLTGSWMTTVSASAVDAAVVSLPTGRWSIVVTADTVVAQPVAMPEDRVVERVTVQSGHRVQALGEDRTQPFDFACTTTGEYHWKSIGAQLRLTVVHDNCPARRVVFSSANWTPTTSTH